MEHLSAPLADVRRLRIGGRQMIALDTGVIVPAVWSQTPEPTPCVLADGQALTLHADSEQISLTRS